MSNNLKNLRQQKGLTLEQLAEKVGSSLRMLQYLEAGERQLTERWIKKLAAALGVDPSAILSGETVPHSGGSQSRRLLLVNAVRMASKGDTDDIIKSAADMLDRYLIEAEADGDLTEDSLKAAAKTALLSAKQRLQNID